MTDAPVELTRTTLALGTEDVALATAGTGCPVLVFGAGFAGSAAHLALARRFQVVAIDPIPSSDALPQAVADWIAAKGWNLVGFVGLPDATLPALAAAAATPQANAIVLVAPAGLDAAGAALRQAAPPKLVLLGTNDRKLGDGAVSRLRRDLTQCSVVFVYEAGSDPASDRPTAFAQVTGDFLDRQGRFIFATESVALQHEDFRSSQPKI
jgi:pimeloyl-ACP methyl ester carboxylesterase